jgi:hypothetical protein
MSKLDHVRSAILNEAEGEQAARQLMDLEAVKTEMLAWLAELKLPVGSTVDSWDSLIREFPAQPDEDNSRAGLRVRLALRLYTGQNQYLISIMENLNPDSRDIYVVSAHVNWKSDERRMQKLVDEGYLGQFNNLLRAKHTLWAQTFRMKELADALNSCATAILANELTPEPAPNLKQKPVARRQPLSPRFPKPVDD